MTEQTKHEQNKEGFRNASPFLRNVDSFTDYVHGEYFGDSSDNRKSLFVIAVDGTAVSGTLENSDECSILNATYGNGELLARGILSAMKNPDLRPMFRRTALSVFEHELQAEIVDRRRRHVKRGFFLIAVVSVWLAVLLFAGIAGGIPWISTVSSAVVMAVAVYALSCDIMFNRQLIRRYGSIVSEDRYEKCKHVLSRLAEAVRLCRMRLRDEEDDDDE